MKKIFASALALLLSTQAFAISSIAPGNFEVLEGGVSKGRERKLNFSSGATVTDNPALSRLDVEIEEIGDTYNRFVKNGESIQTVLTSIGDAANAAAYIVDSTSRYVIHVGPGVYTENLTIPARRHIELQLEGALITGNVTIAPPDLNAGSLYAQKIVISGNDLRSAYEGIGQSVTGITGSIYVTPVGGTNYRPQIHILNSGVTGNIEFTNGTGSYQGFVFLSKVLLIGKVISNNAGLLVTLNAYDCDTSSTKSLGGATGDVLLNVLRNIRWIGAIAVTADGSNYRWSNVDFGTSLGHNFTGSTLTANADANSATSFLSGVASGNRTTVTLELPDAAIGVKNTPSGNLAATNVQAALDELQTDVDTRATSAALTSGLAGKEDSITALSNAKGGTGTGTYAAGDILYASAANTLSKLAAGASNQILQINPATGLPRWFNGVDISYCHWMEEDFVAPAGGKYQLSNSVANSGTVAVLSSAGLGNHMGLINLSTGAVSASGTAGQAANANYQPFRFDAASYVFEIVAKIPTLSDGTNTFAVGMGLADMDTGGPVPPQASLGGAYFRYHSPTNSGKWQSVTANNGPANVEAKDTGIAADTNFHRFTIVVPQSTASIGFYIDGVLVQTNTNNVPTTIAANQHWRINKTVGTAARNLHVDAYSLYYCYGTQR